MKKLIVFDLDNVLTRSKEDLDPEMARLISQLLKKYEVAVISGVSFKQFQKQFLEKFINANLDDIRKLFLLPMCGAAFYKYDAMLNKWVLVYMEKLRPSERGRIQMAIGRALNKLNFTFPKLYGKQIEDRKTQITFSALGQKAPIELKEAWDPNYSKRLALKAKIEESLIGFDVRIGGKTSIDITRKGVDKGFGVSKLLKEIALEKHEVLFVGDELQEGGNDYSVKALGIDCFEVKNVDETKQFIKNLIFSFN